MPARNTVEIVITAKDQASHVLKGIGSGMQGLGAIATAGLGVAALAAGGLTAALYDAAQAGASFQGIEEAFAGLAEASGKSTDRLVSELKRGSAGMASQRDLMLSFNKAASLVSLDFANTLPDAMQYLSKVSSATGQDMSFMIDSLVTGVGRLSPMILDNLGIQVDLNEAYEAYAASIGKSADELTKQEQQTALMNQVMEKLAANTANLPDVTGQADTMMAQFTAQLTDFRDIVGKSLIPAMTKFLEIFILIFANIAPGAQQFLETQLAPALESIANIVDYLVFGDFKGGIFGLHEDHPAVDFFRQLRRGIMAIRAGVPVFDVLAHALNEIAGRAEDYGMTDLANGLRTVAELIANFLKPIGDWISENIKLQDVLIALGIAIAAFLIPILVSIAAAAAPIIGAFVLITLAVAALRQAWETNFMGIRDRAAEFAAWLQVNIPIAMQAVADFWESTLKPALESLWTFLAQTVIPVVIRLAQQFIAFLPVALQTAADFWNNTLLPAMRQAAIFIATDVIPVMLNIYTWLATNIPMAIQTVSTFWQTTLLPAIQTVWSFIQTNLIPVLMTVWDWINTNLPGALQFLANAWNTVLYPAIQEIWNFIQTYIVPLFSALVDVHFAALQVAFTAIQGAWDNVLRPALEDLWEFIQNNIIPLFGDASSEINTNLTPAMQALQTIANLIKKAFDGVKQAVQFVIDRLRELANSIRTLQLPDWLTPGSPTPFEWGLRGISDALSELNNVGLPQFNSQLPQTPATLPTVPQGGNVPQQGQAGQGNNITVVFEGATSIKTQQEADDAAFMMVNGMRARGVNI